jgi:hypothetical protein
LSVAILISHYIAIDMLPLFNARAEDIPYIRDHMENWQQLPAWIKVVFPFPIVAPLQILAFMMGALYVRDARLSAHATIVKGGEEQKVDTTMTSAMKIA